MSSRFSIINLKLLIALVITVIMIYTVFINTVLLYLITGSSSEDCLSRDYGHGSIVCICNKDHCDKIAEIPKVDNDTFIKYTSNQDGLRFKQEKGNITFKYNSNYSLNRITITNESFQEIQGFGGAFTDATGINILSLEEDLQDVLIRAYFSKDGIEYNLGRVPMGATDFSASPYSYHEEEDPNLTKFALAPEDHNLKIPIIKKAMNYSNYELDLFTATWVAPKWMKTNGEYSGFGGRIKDGLYETWANYFVKFLDEYQKENITFWGISTGNEPSLALTFSKIPSVAWGSTQMRNFVSNYLGPNIRNSSHSHLKLMLLDDQRLFLPWFVDQVFEDNSTAKDYVDGIAVHWYEDFLISPNVLSETRNKYPDKFILATEASAGVSPQKPALLGYWNRAEQYASSIIQDMNHWITGWVDWNLALDLIGGPTYINNFVDSPIIVNATGGEFYKQPMFYALGHFSKFIPRGSVRIFTSQVDDEVPVAAFRRPDDRIVVVLLNKKSAPYRIVIEDYRIGQLEVELSSRSITTIVYYFAYDTSLSSIIQPNILLILSYSFINFVYF